MSRGSSGNDTLIGGVGNNSFDDDSQGADSSVGGGGNDIFEYVGYGDAADRYDGGAGRDTYRVYAYNGTSALGSRISDFQAGAGGDIVDITNTYGYFQNWSFSTNPFASGYLALIDNGLGDVLLRIDYDGAGTSYAMQTLLRFDDTVLTDFTADNFNPGWSPFTTTGLNIVDDDIGHTLNGSADNDTIVGNGGNDGIYASYGDDSVTGDAGADYVDRRTTVTTPFWPARTTTRSMPATVTTASRATPAMIT